MKMLGIIPARYSSSRLPGKPLVDICGKPMIWWVYNQASKVKGLDPIVATDDQRIVDTCEIYKIPCIMTGQHSTHIDRIHEVSEKIDADYYVCICGDEPIIDPQTIEAVLPSSTVSDSVYAGALMRELTEPTEVNDPGNIKVVTDADGYCMMLSRSPIPFPYKTVLYRYRKIMGVECYNKKALDLFVSTAKGLAESIEDITLMRFLEAHAQIKFTMVKSEALSVDTERDLEKIRAIISSRLQMQSEEIAKIRHRTEMK